ncbi:MAG: 4Fe-4S dicluster domain-containing protein, partial [Verrucomicrobiota bacterium]|nr:4Fe-4S dicluster domain-containing protein [Verrucomicrobiota bacterium]
QGVVWIQPGQADNVLGLPLGYGRRSGRIANFRYRKTDTRGVGFDFYPLRTSTAANFVTGAEIGHVEGSSELACTQDHWSMEGRAIIREANLDHYAGHKDFANHMGMDSPAHKAHMPKVDDEIYEHPYKAKPTLKSDVHQWGMVVDLNACTGCNACVVACQSENNIPIVGRDQVERGREMHWLRIDRYYTGVGHHPQENSTAADEAQHLEEWIDDPQVANQPMLCQHCESAPCESVCPVNATVHDEEGLNVMVYNRCVGTRYCSNNCAWKVRRFNYFDYNKRPLQDLYQGPLATKSDDEYDLIALAKNPDVSVRMRGVMEKCTFCVQRIEQAKIATKVAARDSDDVTVPDGDIQTACQQSCPAQAIEFGNLLDKDSRVSQSRADERNYAVLGFLDTKPRTTYLARVRNPNPAMPDAPQEPYSVQEQPSHGHEDHDHGKGELKKNGH